MRLAPIALSVLLTSSCVATAHRTSTPASTTSTSSAPTTASPATNTSANRAAASPDERPGVFAPDGATAISIWPEAWRGELLVLEVVPHGASVKSGDVLARLDTRAIDEDVHQAELELASMELRHESLLAKDRVEEDAARSTRERSEAEARRAARALEGYKTKELDFARRGDDLARERTKSNVEDQVDELTQLEKMYKGDELVDATEDIVLKRSKRDLALSRIGQALQDEQIRYRTEYDRARETEVREEGVRQARESLARLTTTQAIEARARVDAEKRSQDALQIAREKLERLRRDREHMVVTAPRDGVCLHGSAKDYHPGRAPKIVARGQTLAPKMDVLLVADPEPRVVELEVLESRLDSVTPKAKVRLISGTSSASGALSVEPYPAASPSADDGVHDARVKLDAPIAGALYGMRARVSFASSGGDSGAKKGTPE